MIENNIPIKNINVLINKKDIPVSTISKYQKDRSKFYWYTARILLERVSWYLDNINFLEYPVIYFSNRRQSKVSDFINYLNILKTDAKIKTINWHSFRIDENHIQSLPHNQRAGLQFADCFATAFSKYVFEKNSFGDTETSYARTLKPFVYNKDNNYKSYGLKILGTIKECNKETLDLLKEYKIES